MIASDIEKFAQILADVWALWPNAKPLTENQATIFFRAMSSHALSEVQAAFDAHVKDATRGRFPPTPADLVAQIQGRAAGDGRPGADEAWAIAVVAADERDTVVWSAEIEAAWSLAKPVFTRGDEIGARMAFRDAYNRLVDDARRAGIGPQWRVSEGFDATLRAVRVQRAVESGLLPGAELLAIGGRRSDPVALLGAPGLGVPAAFLETLARFKQVVADKALLKPGIDAIEKQRTVELKAESAAVVETYAESAAAVETYVGGAPP